MRPTKLIDVLEAFRDDPPEPPRLPERLQKEINELLSSFKEMAEAGRFREQYRYPNRDVNSGETDLIVRELLILGFGVRRFGDNIEVQWDVLGDRPNHVTKFHAIAKRNILGRVLDEFDDVMPEVNLGSIEVSNLEHLTPSDLAMCASFLEEVGFLPTVKSKEHTIEISWED